MQLKPQDVVVLLKLLEYEEARPSYAELGEELFLSPSEIHAAVRRAKHAHLVSGQGDKPNKAALLEFLLHGVKYTFPAMRGELTRGIPTSYAAEPLSKEISRGTDPPPVWPSARGNARGYSLAPLYKTAPLAAQRDKSLYEMLALIDAIRDGRTRERQIAERELEARLSSE